ncbi:MAG: hypothetical protein PHU85_04240 [Phycisphaerae bacterium]|nr:hypothetical protein [Phycisphaerae bacterium]
MNTATPHLDRLARRWRDRVLLARAAEAFLVLSLGAWAAGVAAPAVVAAGWRTPVRIAGLIALLPIMTALFLLTSRKPIGWLRTEMFALILAGWAFGWTLLPRLVGDWAAGPNDLAVGIARACAPLIVTATAVAAFSLSRVGSRVLRWLDAEAGSHLLLHTAAELARSPQPLGEVEAAVVARAETLAAAVEPFRQVSAWRIPARVWALLPILLATTGLMAWISFHLRQPIDNEPQVVDVSASAGQQAANTLVQLALVANRQGDTAVADAVRDAAAQMSQHPNGGGPLDPKTALKAQVAAAKPVLEALGALGGQRAGELLTAVLADPAQSSQAAVAAAAAKVGEWQKASLSPQERSELAVQLREAARQVRDANPELADRLNRTADALVAGQWDVVLDSVTAIVRQVQPIARGQRIAEAALRIIDEALASAAPTPAPITNIAPPPVASSAVVLPADPRWNAGREESRQDLGQLPVEQQEIVRRYFALEK